MDWMLQDSDEDQHSKELYAANKIVDAEERNPALVVKTYHLKQNHNP
jgi:hypothetical protein